MNTSVCTAGGCVHVTCDDASLTAHSEFETHATCDIPIALDTAFRSVNVVLPLLLFVIMLVVWAVNWRALVAKRAVPRALAVLAPLQYLLVLVRPLVGVLWPAERAATNLGVALVTHVTCAALAGIAILFVYLQARLLERGSLRTKQDTLPVWSWLSHHLRAIFTGLAILQAVLFVGGAPLAYYYPRALHPMVAFWSVVAFVDLTAIPLYIALGLSIYLRLRRAIGDRHRRLARHLLLSIVACAVIGTFTGVVALVASLRLMGKYDWILVELCFFSACFFYGFIFILVQRKQQRDHVVSSSASATPAPDKSTGSSGSGAGVTPVNTRN